MDKDQAIAVIQKLYATKATSLAGYLLNSEPYIEPGKEGLFEVLKAIALKEVECAKRLERLMAELGASPHLTTPDPNYAELNFLNITYLFALLKENLISQIQELSSAAHTLRDISSAEQAITEVLKLTQESLADLGNFAQSNS